MSQRIEVGIVPERLEAGQRFRIRRPEGVLWAEVPENASYGTEIRIRTDSEDLVLVLVPPRQRNRQEEPAAPPTGERSRPGPQFSWRGLLLDRLPENAIVAGTPNFWDRVREELWESVHAKREFGGLCVFEERPEGLLLYDLEKRWQGEEGHVEMVFEEGELLWHTHPTVDEGADRFSEEDLSASDSARRPLIVFSFGRTAPGFLARFMVLPSIPTIVAGLSIRGVLELEKRGVIPPNLMRYGIRGKIHIPGRGDFDILQVEKENPRTLADAKPVGLDRYTQPAWDVAKSAGKTALDAGKTALDAGKTAFQAGKRFIREKTGNDFDSER